MTDVQVAFEKQWDLVRSPRHADGSVWCAPFSNFGQELNNFAAKIHAANAHFYRDLTTGEPIGNVGEKNALIHSEVSEMLEGARKGCKDDHLPHRSMEEVEAADVLIRLLDYCAWRGLDLGGATAEKLEYNRNRADHKDDARRAAGGKKF
jgi:hypothetical protein